MGRPLDVEATTAGGRDVLTVAGELDLIAAPVLQQAVDRVLDQGSARLVLDLSGVRFLDSAGLRVLVSAQRALTDENGQLQIVCATPRVLEVFRVANLDDYLRVFGSLEDALAET